MFLPVSLSPGPVPLSRTASSVCTRVTQDSPSCAFPRASSEAPFLSDLRESFCAGPSGGWGSQDVWFPVLLEGESSLKALCGTVWQAPLAASLSFRGRGLCCHFVSTEPRSLEHGQGGAQPVSWCGHLQGPGLVWTM